MCSETNPAVSDVVAITINELAVHWRQYPFPRSRTLGWLLIYQVKVWHTNLDWHDVLTQISGMSCIQDVFHNGRLLWMGLGECQVVLIQTCVR